MPSPPLPWEQLACGVSVGRSAVSLGPRLQERPQGSCMAVFKPAQWGAGRVTLKLMTGCEGGLPGWG